MNNPAPTLSGLARRLVTDGLLDQELARQAMAQASKEKTPFVLHLVKNAMLDAHTIARVASEEFGTPLFDLNTLTRESTPAKLVSETLTRKQCSLPL